MQSEGAKSRPSPAGELVTLSSWAVTGRTLQWCAAQRRVRRNTSALLSLGLSATHFLVLPHFTNIATWRQGPGVSGNSKVPTSACTVPCLINPNESLVTTTNATVPAGSCNRPYARKWCLVSCRATVCVRRTPQKGAWWCGENNSFPLPARTKRPRAGRRKAQASAWFCDAWYHHGDTDPTHRCHWPGRRASCGFHIQKGGPVLLRIRRCPPVIQEISLRHAAGRTPLDDAGSSIAPGARQLGPRGSAVSERTRGCDGHERKLRHPGPPLSPFSS